MKPNIFLITLLASALALTAMAQNSAPPPPSTVAAPLMAPLPDPQPSAAPVPMEPQPSPAATSVPPATATPPVLESTVPAATPAPAAVSVPAQEPIHAVTPATNEIRMNFQGAALGDVLNYLSEAAGFVIVQETPVSGTVNIMSKQPVTKEEAVELLNAVLIQKGYVAVRNGRILKIVSSRDAQKYDLPVVTGSDPEKIPRKDGTVTQILPIRFLEAGKLIENLRPLLSADATINANDSSNAILLTDTQTNIHRMAEIIHALDTNISSISTIHVFPLRYADAKDFANVLTQLFSPDQAAGRNGQNNQNQQAFGRFRGGQGGGNAPPAAPESEARKAASRVIAVPDVQSNSVVVSAPEEYMTTITEIVNRLDTSTTDLTETRIFRLEHADSVELSGILNSLYGDGSTSGSSGNRGTQNGQGGQNSQRNGQNRQQQGNNNQRTAGQSSSPSERSLLQARVVAVPDPRTNSIIVDASRDTMEQIALTIGRLDASDSKKQHVYVHVLEHADPDNVATILRGMFSTQSGGSTSNQPASNALNQRTSTGASAAVTGSLNTTGRSSTGR